MMKKCKILGTAAAMMLVFALAGDVYKRQALLFAALSTLFTIIEIPNKWLEESTHMSHRKSTTITSLIIFAGGIIVSLGFGVLSNVQLPFLDVHGVAYYNIYNWLDTFTAYKMCIRDRCTEVGDAIS